MCRKKRDENEWLIDGKQENKTEQQKGVKKKKNPESNDFVIINDRKKQEMKTT